MLKYLICVYVLVLAPFALAHDFLNGNAFGAAESIAPVDVTVLRISAEQQNAVRAYLEGLYRKLDYPGEEGLSRPEFVLYRGGKGRGSFTVRSRPGVIFWNANLFVDSPSEDVDLFYMAIERTRRERTKVFAENQVPFDQLFTLLEQPKSSDDDQERQMDIALQYIEHLGGTFQTSKDPNADYDAVISGVQGRLLRTGERAGRAPAPALVSIEALIQYLSTLDKQTSLIAIPPEVIISGLRFAFLEERPKRFIPAAAQSRTSIDAIAREVKNQIGVPEKKEKRNRPGWREDFEFGLLAYDYSNKNWPKVLLRADNALHRSELGPSDLVVGSFLKAAQEIFKDSAEMDADLVARVPPNIFERWRALKSHSYLEYALRSASDFDFDVSALIDNPEHLRSIDASLARNFIFGSKFERNAALISAPRIFGFMLEFKDRIDLHQTPQFTFILQALLAQSELDYSIRNKKLPRVVRQFRKAFGAKINGALDIPEIGAILAFDPQNYPNIARLFLQLDHRRLFPGLAEYLLKHCLLKNDPILKIALETNGANLKQELLQIQGRVDSTHILEALEWIYAGNPELVRRQGLDELYLEIVKSPGESYLRALRKSPLLVESSKAKPEFAKSARQILTERAQRDPIAFSRSLLLETDRQTGVLDLYDWAEIFKDLSADDLISILSASSGAVQITSIEDLRAFNHALINQLVSKIENASSSEQIRLGAATFAYLNATSADAQRLIKLMLYNLYDRQSETGSNALAKTPRNLAFERLLFLESVRPLHFDDPERYVTLYLEALLQSYGGVESFRTTDLRNVSRKLDFIREHFEPQIALTMLNRLAEAYQADWNSRPQFMLYHDKDDPRITSALTNFEVWRKIMENMSRAEAMKLIECLRSDVLLAPLWRDRIRDQLAQMGIMVATTEVETYLRLKFRSLTPVARAGVFQMIIEGSSELMKKPRFRKAIYNRILERLPGQALRQTFLDVWQAGMTALPNSLRSILLSVSLSESGQIGSPEQALVTFLSHQGPLEQKFGQTLAMTDLPESYRDALSTLWDAAQNLTWWQAWDLVQLQYGDIRQAGYRLTRILNSGTTMAYLEVENKTTGTKYALPVFRDGIEQSVKIGTEQLQTFTQALVQKSRRTYGFLPLLTEDARRTMKLELDLSYKRAMTVQMGEAYRRAALRLGWSVDPQGIIQGPTTKFTTVQNHRIEFGDKPFFVQDLVAGEPLRKLKEMSRPRYLEVTEELLRLEDEVQNDPLAPVDKDRMPGQNLFNVATQTTTMLDHGQAVVLEERVHALFKPFTRAGLLGDTAWMSQELTKLTGVKPKSFHLKGRVRAAALGVRPLVYLQEVSPAYLKMEDSDPRKILFFQLVHGVRARLRLLQWEQMEGLSRMSGQLQNELFAQHNKTTLAVGVGAQRVIGHLRSAWGWIKEKLWSLIGQTPAVRMDRAYLKQEPKTAKECASQLMARLKRHF